MIKKLVYRTIVRMLSLYWRLFHIPLVLDLTLDENWTGLNWRRYFLYTYKVIWRGYKCLDRAEILKKGYCTEELLEKIEKLDESTYSKIHFWNINIWEVCRGSYLSECNKVKPDFNNERDVEILKAYFKEVVKYLTGLKKILSSQNVRAIMYSQGASYASRCTLEIGQRLGITTVAIENTFISDRFYADNTSGMIINRHALASSIWHRLRAKVLTAEEKAKLRDVIKSLYKKKAAEHSTDDSMSFKELCEFYQIPNGKRIALLVGQVLTDASLVYDSEIFPDPIEFIIRVIEFFQKQEDWYLIVSLHPYEAFGITNSRLMGKYQPLDNITLKNLQMKGYCGGERYCIVSGKTVSTKVIMDNADLGITLTSQAGLEMLLMGKPVVIGGYATYRGKGFTFDIPSAELLETVLKFAISNPTLTELQKEKIDTFAYSLIFEYSFPKDVTKLGRRFDDLFRARQGFTGLFRLNTHP